MDPYAPPQPSPVVLFDAALRSPVDDDTKLRFLLSRSAPEVAPVFLIAARLNGALRTLGEVARTTMLRIRRYVIAWARKNWRLVAVELRRAGRTVRWISRTLHVPRRRVAGWLRDAGVLAWAAI